MPPANWRAVPRSPRILPLPLLALGILILWRASVTTAFAHPPNHETHSKSSGQHDPKSGKSKKDPPHGRKASKAHERARHEAPVHEPDDTTPRTASNPADPREQRISQLRERLENLLHEKPLSRTRIGVTVLDARDGDVLYAHNADRLFNPASNTKILTTAAALEQLGGNYHYQTQLRGPEPDEHGVVHGSVELRGTGDPSLTTQGLAEIACDLAARGITRIEGDVLADGKFRDPKHPGEALGGGALILNRNVYTVHVRPTEPRHNAIVTVEPYSPEYFVVENKVTTVSGRRTRLRLDAYRRDGKFVVVAKGRINPKADVKLKEHLGDGALYAAATLRGALLDYGIEMGGGIQSGGLSGDAPLLAEHQSIPLAEICRVSNKDSNNFVADTIFKTLGREKFGGAATLQKGARAVEELLAPIGLTPGLMKIVNGSGLTHENRVQPLALVKLLRHLYFDLAVAPDFLTSLAVGGIDGTIKNRFSGDMVGRVRAKTGTLSNVSALSGYVGDTGEVLIFSILVDNFHHRSLEEIRHAQVQLVREMMAYVRAGKPGGLTPPSTAPSNEKIPLDWDEGETGEPEGTDVENPEAGSTGN